MKILQFLAHLSFTAGKRDVTEFMYDRRQSYTSMEKTIVILAHVLRTSTVIYGRFRAAIRLVTAVYGFRNQPPREREKLSTFIRFSQKEPTPNLDS